MTSYWMIKQFTNYTLSLIFRDIELINEDQIPKQGGTIIYGNHNNQFIDAMLLLNQVPRKIHFIAAAVSCRRPVVGNLIKMSNAIPVERPQDLAKAGKGKIISCEKGKMIGNGTKFTSIQKGSSISINKGPQIIVSQVIDDFTLLTKSECPDFEGQNYDFKVTPKLQYNDLYDEVWKTLANGQCIGIFPQGGSHDKLSHLPFKAGICIMALGAMAKYDKPVTIVPCGFHYYNQQNFRSKVIMEFGPAYKITQQLLSHYKRNKRQAIGILLDDLQRMLKSVTITSTTMKSYNELSLLYLCRELYTMNCKRQLKTQEKIQLNRRFAKGFDHLAQKPQFLSVYKDLEKFNEVKKVYGLLIRRDSFGEIFIVDLIKFLIFLQKCIVRLILSLPGLILLGPTTTMIAYLSQKQRIKCLKNSKVKQHGTDVVSSYKLLLWIIMFPMTITFNSLALFGILVKFIQMDSWKAGKICLAFGACLPIYAYLLVKSYDSLGRSFVKLKYLFLRLFKRNIYKDFVAMKKKLSKKILDLVDEHGQNLNEGFERKRIILPEDMIHRSSHLQILEDNSQINDFLQNRETRMKQA